MKKNLKKNAGFSLIELLFAVVFLSVIIVGMIKLQTSTASLANHQKNNLTAALYSSQGLEIVASMDFNQLANCADICYLKNNGGTFTLGNNGEEVLDNDQFTRRIEKITPLQNAFLVQSVVSWEDSSGPHESTAKRVIFAK